MADIIHIDSLSDPALAPYARLTEAQLRTGGALIAEGLKVIEAALDAGARCTSLLMEEKHVQGKAAALIARANVPVYAADAETLEALTGYALTRGVLACFERPGVRTPEAVLDGARRVLVLDGLNDAENVGALFRSAAALGYDALLLTDTCRDPLTRRTLRVSMGTVLRLKWAAIPRLERGGAELLARFGFETIALALRDDALRLNDPVLKLAARRALVLGAEGDGLSAGCIAACDRCAVIPMADGVDSLNVAAAGAIAMWELR